MTVETMENPAPHNTELDVLTMARQVGLSVPEACLPGVVANTELLRSYVALVDGLPLPDHCEPAFGYVP